VEIKYATFGRTGPGPGRETLRDVLAERRLAGQNPKILGYPQEK
jgi:hypothetical protein